MRIALLGYGKMGNVIDAIAQQRGHTVVARPSVNQRDDLLAARPDVVMEFTHPDAAFDNVAFCLYHQVPVVCGTTGWLNRLPEITQLVAQTNGLFFYAANYSLGVNVFFRLNDQLARLMNHCPQYEVTITETHHLDKKDAPSGTALALANGLTQHLTRKTGWCPPSATVPQKDQVVIHSLRQPDVPGTHAVQYDSETDSIEIRHVAHSRRGFGEGAVVAAEWLLTQREAHRTGHYGMNDLLGF